MINLEIRVTQTYWMMEEMKQRFWHFKTKETHTRHVWREPAPDQVRITDSVTIVTNLEFKLPLFLKKAEVTRLSLVWLTSFSETESDFQLFQG